ncbi:MAG: hypothetical protein WCO28_09895 [Bacteroidota bacterium]
MSVSKQLAMNFSVNGKKLPIEVIDIIKSFAFEDRVVRFAKKMTKQVVKMINCAVIYNYINGAIASRDFRVYHGVDPLFLSIKNANCRVCGEFENEIIANCVCNYSINKDYYNDQYDDQYDDQYEDDPWYGQY